MKKLTLLALAASVSVFPLGARAEEAVTIESGMPAVCTADAAKMAEVPANQMDGGGMDGQSMSGGSMDHSTMDHGAMAMGGSDQGTAGGSDGGDDAAAAEDMPMDGDVPMDMDAGHTAMMDGMDQMNSDMMDGMMAKDIDVAFICGMIPHHRGAIAMAKAELKYGKDEWSRKLAEDIIAAQEKEIQGMLDWLAKRQ